MSDQTRPQLCLGTAQFGMEYGLRPHGRPATKPTLGDVLVMLGEAYDRGVRWLDTAAAYGDAEQRIGSVGANEFLISTKLRPNLFAEPLNPAGILDVVMTEAAESAARLRRSPDVYLLHSERYIYAPPVVEAMQRVRREGLAGLVGVSCYEPSAAREAMAAGLDCFQVPFNVLDQRFARQGIFEAARQRGLTVFARQPFLQSLLLLSPEQIPEHLAHARPHVARFQALCREQECSPLEAALHFCIMEPGIDVVVFGVEDLAQLRQVLFIADAAVPHGFDREAFVRAFADMPQAVVNPSRWAVA